MDEDAQILQFNSSCAQIYGLETEKEFFGALESGISSRYTFTIKKYSAVLSGCIHGKNW